MKKYISITALAVFGMASSQVIIGDETGTAADKTSVLLDFAEGENKGIILPYVRTLPTGAGLAEGTILLDAVDATKAKVKYYRGNNDWFDLSSNNEADISNAMTSQPSTAETTTKGAIIGSNTSSADGVLILESTDKAMVLPQVEDVDDIIKPAPGMMVYVTGTTANPNKRLAVFNGGGWTFWKPQ
ncbi:MAG: hypothetical protein QM564_02870 [Bergeyella sp.]